MKKPHKRLFAWRKSMDLVVKIYGLTKKLSARRSLRSYIANPARGSIRSFEY